VALTTVGQQLKAARSLLSVSQEQVANALGVCTHTVARAEHDNRHSRLMQRALRDLYTRNGVSFTDNGVQRVFKPQPTRQAEAASD
jgi:transcriptional regulator with XRE-family HTH domain